jgi:hypothetical protein
MSRDYGNHIKFDGRDGNTEFDLLALDLSLATQIHCATGSVCAPKLVGAL